jgi:hypothetical protein
VANGEWRVAFAVNAFLTAETQKNNKRKKSLHSLRLCGKKIQPQRRRRITREKNLCTLCAFAVKKFNRRGAEE